MEICPTRSPRCTVCGMESTSHAGWFLVLENGWLDTIKVLSWHPALAEQEQIRSVCGKRHLRALITHWLRYANLRFDAARAEEFRLGPEDSASSDELQPGSAGLLVGELAVHRESLSKLWTGSLQERESIFEALTGRRETQQTAQTGITASSKSQPDALPSFADAFFQEYALP